MNTVVAHHTAHIETAIEGYARVEREISACGTEYREAARDARYWRHLLALDLYWCHAQRMCEYARGDYR